MAVECVWHTTTADSTSEELAYFAAFRFAVPVAAGQICALPLQHMFDWLLRPHGPPLTEGDECNINGHVPQRAFALLAVPWFLYGPGGTPSPNPMIGLGVVFIPPYIIKLSFKDAYFFLNQWVRIGSEPLTEEQIVFCMALLRVPQSLIYSPTQCGWTMLLRTSLRRLQSMPLYIVLEPSVSTESLR